MSRPSKFPDWNTSGSNNSEPSSGAKSTGWAVNDVPPSTTLNWLQKLYNDWIKEHDLRLGFLRLRNWPAAPTSGFSGDAINAAAWGPIAVSTGSAIKSTFVIVGNNAKLSSSKDGVTWTSRTSQFTADNINSVACNGSNMFVAVGAAGKLSSSPDGITWTSRTSGFGATPINKVIFANNIWVAVGNAGKISTSTNGTSWTSRTSGAGATNITNVIYAGGQFVIQADAKIATSPDGITWTLQTSSLTGMSAKGLAYGNGIYVALNGTLGATNVWTSPDGITWTSRTIDTTFVAGFLTEVSIAFNGTIFCITGDYSFFAGDTTGVSFVSSDGITWTDWTTAGAANQTPNGTIHTIDGFFVGACVGGISVSFDGINFYVARQATTISPTGFFDANGTLLGFSSDSLSLASFF